MKKLLSLRLPIALLCIYLPQCWVFVVAAEKGETSSIWLWVKMFPILPGIPAAFLWPNRESDMVWYTVAGIATLLAIIISLRVGRGSKGAFAVMAVLLALGSTWVAMINYALYAA